MLDLGGGHTFEFTCAMRDGVEVENAGGIHRHPRPDGSGECAGAVTFREFAYDGHPVWDVESFDPLTLSPSLLCRSCGSHGFIRNGKWVES